MYGNLLYLTTTFLYVVGFDIGKMKKHVLGSFVYNLTFVCIALLRIILLNLNNLKIYPRLAIQIYLMFIASVSRVTRDIIHYRPRAIPLT